VTGMMRPLATSWVRKTKHWKK